MKESLDRDFPKFIEKNGEVLKMIASDSSAKLETLWRVLVYIFDFNYLCLYDTLDGATYHKNFECDRSPLKAIPPLEDFADLMKSVYQRDKAESTQKEEELYDNILLVEALAAIPLVIDKTKKILLICKQLQKSKDEVAQGYIFDSYKLQLYLSVIKSFVQIHEQQKQLQQSKSLISLGTWAALAGGILASLEVISSIIECMRNFQGYSFLEMVEGLSIVALLVFFIAATIRLLMSKIPVKFFANWPGTLAKAFRKKNTTLRLEPITSPPPSAQTHTPAN